ncbi:MAG: hypothetical protein KJ872_07035, partial [Alphaproteobacteria bacterium]|nr:hypothetical protein [Alphaproteobacteria bacterium]
SRTALAGLCLAAFGAGAAQAAAYIKFDGVDGESKVEVQWKVEEADKATPGAGRPATRPAATDLAAPSREPEATSLLLPAVQKVREAAAARPRGMACTPGATLRNLTIRDDQTAQIVRVPEATVTGCTAEQISLNFAKVEATGPMRPRARARR